MARIAGIKPRRGTTAEWAAANAASPSRKLDAGELGYDSTTKDLVVGDGTTAFASLPRVGSGTYERLRGSRTVLVGDSITDNNFSLSPTLTVAAARGYWSWASVLLNDAVQVVRSTSSDGAFGAAGQTTQNVIDGGADGLAGAVAASADFAVVHLGTNDINTSVANATIVANLQTIWAALVRSGKTVIATTILPRAVVADTTAQKQAVLDVNRAIRAAAKATPGVVLCDWYSVLLDASTGLLRTALAYDATLHPNPAGASRLGAALAATMRPLVPNAGTIPVGTSTTDVPNILAANGLMVGTGGTISGANLSGSLAAGWSLFQNGTPTSVVASKVARTDLRPGEWQQFVATAAVATTDGFNFQFQDLTPGGKWDVGSLVQARAEFETDAAGWDMRSMVLNLQCFSSTGAATSLYTVTGDRTASTLPVWRPPSGVLSTPPFVVPAATSRVQAQIVCFGSGTIRVGAVEMVNLTAAGLAQL